MDGWRDKEQSTLLSIEKGRFSTGSFRVSALKVAERETRQPLSERVPGPYVPPTTSGQKEGGKYRV